MCIRDSLNPPAIAEARSKKPRRGAIQPWPPTAEERAANPHVLGLVQQPGEGTHASLARYVAGPVTNATRTINAVHQGEFAGATLDATALMHELEQQVKAVNNGSLARGEAMLVSQAHTLDAMFHALALKAMTHTTMPPYETLLRLAFKAQSQCRATLEALAEIKNPRAVFVKQANIANGHQQINNGSGAREIESVPSKLLETTRNEWMDTRAQGAAGRANQALETLGTVNGAAQ